MTKREIHASLLEKFIKAESSKEKAKLHRQMESLTQIKFRDCAKCGDAFLHKCFEDELPAPEEIECPACRNSLT